MAETARSLVTRGFGRSRARVPPPQAYFVGSAVFHYLGPSFAVLLFARVDVLGVAWLRIASAAVVMGLWRRPLRRFAALERNDKALVVALGAVFAVMNACFYIAIDRLPLANVAAIEFVGPIALALVGACSTRNWLAVAAATAGVYMITHVQFGGQVVGIAFALANAALFAIYIVLAHRVARSAAMTGIDGLAVAMLFALVFVFPIGFAGALHAFTDPVAIGAGIGVGVSSSVIPYVFDQLAMARLARATYALFVSMLPACAVLIGVVVLSQIPSLGELGGIGLVMVGVAVHRERELRASKPLRPRQTRERAACSGPMTVGARWRGTAEVLVDQLGVCASDRLLLVCNPAAADLGELLASVTSAARHRTARVDVCDYAAESCDGEEPPDVFAVVLFGATAAALLTRFSISRTQACLQATRLGARIASLPGISAEVFARTLPTDYRRLQEDGDSLAEKLTAAGRCHVTGPGGTDVLLSLKGRAAICDDGDLREAGVFGNLPAGWAYIASIESDASGRTAFDGSLGEWGLLDQPLTVEDESASETALFAFGTNTGMGGANQADVHIDAFMLRPRIELDGATILDDGMPIG